MVTQLSSLSRLFAAFPSFKPNDEPLDKPQVESLEMSIFKSNVTSEDEIHACEFGWNSHFKITPKVYLAQLETSIEYLSDIELLEPTWCINFEKSFFNIFSVLDVTATLKKVREQGFITFVTRCIHFFNTNPMVDVMQPSQEELSHVLTVMQMFNGETFKNDFSNEVKKFLSRILVSSFTINYRLTMWLLEFNLDFNEKDFITERNILLEAANAKQWMMITWLINKGAETTQAMQWAKKHNNVPVFDFIEREIKKKQEQQSAS